VVVKLTMQAQIDELKRDKRRTNAILMVQNERISELEHLAGIPPASSIRSGDIHIKTVAGMLDCSISGVHYLASSKVGKLTKVKRGRKTFIRNDVKLQRAYIKTKK
jgi:hypothetical protein